MEKSNLDTAESLLLSAIEERDEERLFGRKNEPSLAGAFGHLGLLYHMEKCELEKSQQNYERALLILKDVEGHFALKSALMHEFAAVMKDQGKYSEAEQMLLQAVINQEKLNASSR